MLKLSQEDLDQFRDRGYLVVKGVLDQENDIQPLIEEYSTVLDCEAEKLVQAGKLTSTYGDLPFLERFARLIVEGNMSMQPFDITLPPKFTEETPMHLGPAVFNHLICNPRILDVVEQLIGPEIYNNAVQHVRIKPNESNINPEFRNPMNANTPWHQDLGVIDPEADESNVISVWVAVSDATIENSCLVVIPGSQREPLAPHCPLNETAGMHKPVAIPAKFLGKGTPIPVPMKAGDAIFFDKLLKHSALPNRSDRIRWSFDLRYNPIDQPNGRSWLPGFVARSRAHPERELKDARAWSDLWRTARSQLASTEQSERPFTRWSPDHPGCA